MAYERQTAIKCRIGHLSEGNYVEREGWDPNVVETKIGEVSRVNIMAVVVGKEGNSLVIDDGSGRMSLRSFNETPSLNFEVGDKLMIIGRPRIFNKEMYIAAEIVRKIENDKWLELRKLEISMTPKVEVKKIVKIEEPVVKSNEATGDEILDVIRKLDTGSGADVGEIALQVKDGDRIIQTMMEEGDVFEVKPGRVKVLD